MGLFLGLALLGLGALVGAPHWRAWQQRGLRAQPFPAAWRRILRRQVPYLARLPPPLKRRLEGHIQVFLAEKAFIGCQGQAITDEVRVVIAAQACLLLLGEAAPQALFPQLRQVLVYPSGFVVERVQHQPGGVQHHRAQALSGESWQQGQVLLSWPDVLAGAARPEDGDNLVLHEFAHQVDQDKGPADGRPWRPSGRERQRWDAVMGEAFARLSWQPDALLGTYAATSPAELFAVATERFFEQPAALAEAWPEVFAELQALYRVDPRAW